MKKILVYTFATVLSCSAMAQEKMAKMDHKSMKMDNCVMMHGGKMMCMKDGKTMPMTSTMTMKNGTMVMADGTVKMKDGKTMMLKDGQSVMLSGKVDKMPMKDHMKM
ncbi:MAG: hypothetical protein EOP41_02305 [Sphingobacteriaceae bacterium]|nr:MAG: hypothetical protein EOP41_02305 [Sphingobacteriaceae bacterium]